MCIFNAFFPEVSCAFLLLYDVVFLPFCVFCCSVYEPMLCKIMLQIWSNSVYQVCCQFKPILMYNHVLLSTLLNFYVLSYTFCILLQHNIINEMHATKSIEKVIILTSNYQVWIDYAHIVCQKMQQ